MKYIFGFGALILILGIVFALLLPNKSSTQNEFSETGTLLVNQPGSTPDTWYLLYEKPGEPALTKNLDFSQANCSITVSSVDCDGLAFLKGDQVNVTGREVENVVFVSTMSLLEL